MCTKARTLLASLLVLSVHTCAHAESTVLANSQLQSCVADGAVRGADARVQAVERTLVICCSPCWVTMLMMGIVGQGRVQAR